MLKFYCDGMREKFINNSLNSIKKKYPEYTDIQLEEIKYGLESLYLTVTKLVVLLVLALILGIIKEFFVFLVLYNLVRLYGFGLHASKTSICLISSILLFIGIPFIAKYFILNKFIIGILGSILLLNFYKYSPADTRKRPIVNPKIRLKYKYLSCSIVIVFLMAAIFINNYYISNLLFIAVLLEGFLINPFVYKIFGFSYDNYKNYHV